MLAGQAPCDHSVGARVVDTRIPASKAVAVFSGLDGSDRACVGPIRPRGCGAERHGRNFRNRVRQAPASAGIVVKRHRSSPVRWRLPGGGCAIPCDEPMIVGNIEHWQVGRMSRFVVGQRREDG